MKRTLTLLSVFFICVSVFAKKVEINDASQAARNFYYEKVNIHSNVPYQSVNITSLYTVSRDNQPVYYVFNINHDEGFVMVSAEDAAKPVLGYSLTGSYSEENQPEQFVYWTNGYAEEITGIRNSQLQQTLELATEWNHLLTTDPSDLQIDKSTRDVEPLLTSTWDQSFPYNAMCPADPASPNGYNGRVPVGCVATAMAQIMYYWRYPYVGQGQHCDAYHNYGTLCADFGNTTYDWEGMNNAPGLECNPIALISYHAGIAVDMNYGPNGSGSYTSKVPSALKNYFRYDGTVMYANKSGYSSTDWENMLKSDLDASKPLEYNGSGPDGGHAWVCDGYQSTNYFHMNWGWGGAENGYFYLSSLNPGGSNFNQQQGAVFHIQPDPAQYPYGCTGIKDVKTFDFGSIEDGSGPIADYGSNLSCSWLIAPDDSVMNVKLTFQRMDTDPNDVIKVYDGENSSATLLGTYSGTTFPTTAIVSTGPKMFVTFTTDGSTAGNGFMATYETQVVPFCTASGILTEPDGILTDGSGRFSYRNGQSCKWKIQPAGATSITLVFDSINTEATNDYIEVYDYLTSTKLGTYSGTSIPDPVTSGAKMMIVFKTNTTIRGGGFGASYTTIVGTEDKALQDLTVYPNPVDAMLNVSFDLKEQSNVSLEVVSISGVIILNKDLGSKSGSISERLDLSSLSGGIYVLRIKTDQGVTNRKIMVK